MQSARYRNAHTLVEVTISLAVVAILSVIVAQTLIWSMRERGRLAANQAALELAANVLEAARGESFEKIDSAWANAQTIPGEMSDLLPHGKLIVTVDTTKTIPMTRRVIAEVRWQSSADRPDQSVRLETLLAPRIAKKATKPGGAP